MWCYGTGHDTGLGINFKIGYNNSTCSRTGCSWIRKQKVFNSPCHTLGSSYFEQQSKFKSKVLLFPILEQKKICNHSQSLIAALFKSHSMTNKQPSELKINSEQNKTAMKSIYYYFPLARVQANSDLEIITLFRLVGEEWDEFGHSF